MPFSWSFHRRKGVIYCQLKNKQTGKYMTARSTGKTSEEEALLVVADWLRYGLPEPGGTGRRSATTAAAVDTILDGIRSADINSTDTQRIIDALRSRGLVEVAVAKGSQSSEPFVDFLKRFWTFDESPYVREKHSHGQQLGRRHCVESLYRVELHWAPRFAGRCLGEITKVDLRQFGEALSASGLSGASVNRILVAGTAALKWAADNGLIESNPGASLMRYSEKPKKRGVLTPDEARALFALDWEDQRSRVANLVAAVTGLRAGEVRALQPRDVGEDRLYVRHSWSDADGLKRPKNGEERVVPLVPSVRDELLSLARSNPYGYADDRFIFYSRLSDKPCEIGLFLDGLKEALVRLSIGETNSKTKREKAEQEWKRRGVVFHSWRHFYASRLADNIELRKVQLATGHKSAAVAEVYAAHALDADFKALGVATVESFGNIVPFCKVAGNE